MLRRHRSRCRGRGPAIKTDRTAKIATLATAADRQSARHAAPQSAVSARHRCLRPASSAMRLPTGRRSPEHSRRPPRWHLPAACGQAADPPPIRATSCHRRDRDHLAARPRRGQAGDRTRPQRPRRGRDRRGKHDCRSARAQARRVGDPAQRGHRIDFARYAAFIAANPSWPGIVGLRRRAQVALWKQQIDPRATIAFFAAACRH